MSYGKFDDRTLDRVNRLKSVFSNYHETCITEGVDSVDATRCQQKATEIITRLNFGDYNFKDLDVLKTFKTVASSDYFSHFYSAAKSAKINQALVRGPW